MICYDNLHFACAPRVGASWFLKACQLSGLGPGFYRELTPHDGTFRVSLIRHPVRWLESVYSARAVGWNSSRLGRIALLEANKGLESFVWQYLEEMPGEVGKTMLAFEADSVMRIEDMPWAFLELAAAIGIDPVFYPNIKKMNKINSSDKVVRMTNVQKRRVIEAEKELCHGFEYF